MLVEQLWFFGNQTADYSCCHPDKFCFSPQVQPNYLPQKRR